MAVTTFETGTARNEVARGGSIKLALIGSIAALMALFAVDLISGTLESWTRHRDAARLQVVDAAGNRLIAGAFEMLLERVATINALQADAPVGAEARSSR
jgi:hypothetical protein